jgi:hypothetical protein
MPQSAGALVQRQRQRRAALALRRVTLNGRGQDAQMACGVTTSVLMARTSLLVEKLQMLSTKGCHPFTTSEIVAIELELSNVRGLLTDVLPGSPADAIGLAVLAQRLDMAAARLDALEELLRGRFEPVKATDLFEP